MNEQEIAALLALAEDGLSKAIQLYKTIAANVTGAKSLSDILADADSTYDQIAQNAKQEGAS